MTEHVVADSPTSQKPRSRAGALFMTLLVLLFVFTYLVRFDPVLFGRVNAMIHRSPSQETKPADFSRLFRGDKSAGTKLPLSPELKRALSAAGKTDIGMLLVWVGDCGGCISANLTAWEAAAERHNVPMVLVTTASGSAVSRFKAEEHLRSPIVSDPTGSLGKEINATWFGRPYLIGPRGHLLWMEKRFPGRYDPFTALELSRFFGTSGAAK
jgi:hypothetical protein